MFAILPVLGLGVLLLLQIWKNQNTYTQYDDCGEKFSLSIWQGALAPHSMGKKLVQCPRSRKMGWATPVAK